MNNQQNRLFKYLKQHGSINPLIALTELGIYRLAARICELRQMGYDIKTKNTTSLNKFGEKVCYATYTMEVAK